MESPEVSGTASGSTSNRSEQYDDQEEEEELKKLAPGKCDYDGTLKYAYS